jgi:hypothetical protein
MTQAAQLAQYGANNVGLSFKNRIINGDMTIDQRNAGASVAIGDVFPVDRWNCYENGSMAFTGQRSTTAPAGFSNSLLITTTTAASPASSSRSQIAQVIEGFNIADLGWGTANASPVTVSFWVRSSLTGQFGGSVMNYAATRSYPFSFTISSANTFEYKTITIPGDTTGTWLTNNSGGLILQFDLGMGSDLLGTAGAWTGADKRGATGDVKLSETLGATYYITGVQLEKGTVATSFDYLPYTTELQLCQRYYFQTIADANGVTSPFSSVIRATANTASITQNFPVAMRTLPSITFVAGSGVLIFGASNESRSLTGAPSTITGSANAPYNFVAFYQNATSITGGTPYCAYIYPGAGYTYSSEL